MSVCLNIPDFAFEYIDFMMFPEYDLGMLSSDSLYLLAIAT